ncbi:G-PROTEIN-RECEP-F1-2 domain-containing protein [Aphelenchoides besseyi]|nr:G-PROTEIN-RECEP-F1-2 domain-containing protein [Aphelenchoides besseyi]
MSTTPVNLLASTIPFDSSNQNTWTPTKAPSNFLLISDTNEKIAAGDHNFIALFILPILCVTGLIGNVLVCIAIWSDKRLHNVTNYFLFSLALADLFVCTIVMPLAILVEVKHGMWIWSFGLCLLFTYADVFLCSASIVHISVISLDRYLGISRPFKVRNKSRTVVVLKICFVWVMTIIISSPLAALAIIDSETILQGNMCTIRSQQYKIYGSTLSFLIPFIIMTITFTKTTQLLNKQANALAQKGERRIQRRTNSSNVMVTTTPRLGSTKRPANGITIQMSPLTPTYTLVNDHTSPLNLDEQDLRVQRSNCNVLTESEESAVVIESKTSGDQRHLREFTELPVLVSHEFAHLRNHIQRRSTRIRSQFNRVRARLLMMARRKQQRIDNTNAELANEHKATRVLAVVFACFFTLPSWLDSVILWLGYLSSTLNPAIYTIFNRRFREAFLRILRCQCLKSREPNYTRNHAVLMTGDATWTCMDKSAIVYKDSVSMANQRNGSIRKSPERMLSNRIRLSERHRVRAVVSHSSSTSSRLMQSMEHLPVNNCQPYEYRSETLAKKSKESAKSSNSTNDLTTNYPTNLKNHIQRERKTSSFNKPFEPTKSNHNMTVKAINISPSNCRPLHPDVGTRGSFTTQDSIPNIDDDVVEEIDYLNTAPVSPLSPSFLFRLVSKASTSHFPSNCHFTPTNNLIFLFQFSHTSIAIKRPKPTC